MLYLRPQSSVFCRACDFISPTYQNHWSADCDPLISGPHFFGVYFICLFINSQASSGPYFLLQSESHWFLLPQITVPRGEQTGRAYSSRKEEDFESYAPQRISSARQDRLIYTALSVVHLPWQYHT